jgi:hypothetical protein
MFNDDISVYTPPRKYSLIFPYDCCCEMLLSDTTALRLFGTTSTRAFTAGSTGQHTVLVSYVHVKHIKKIIFIIYYVSIVAMQI